MTSRRQKYRFYHFCLVSECLDIILKTFFMCARPKPEQTKEHFKNLHFLAVTYDMGVLSCAFDVVKTVVCFCFFKQFLETEMTCSQTIIVRECIFKNQKLCFASR